MNEALSMFTPTTSTATPNVISSPGSADGPMLCASQGGQMINPSGLVVVPANPSASQANAKAPMMNVTSGHSLPDSSKGASLQSSLGNKLRQKMDGRGSPLYSLTWKTWDISGQEPICALRASGHRISDNGYIGLPTVSAREGRDWSQAQILARLDMGDGVAKRICNTSPELRSSQEIVGLNPSFAGWEMGYPNEWNDCAAMAMPSSRK